MDYKNAHVEIGDLVFVRVGVGCIGRAAVITSENEKGIADDWIYEGKGQKNITILPCFLATNSYDSKRDKKISKKSWNCDYSHISIERNTPSIT